MSDLDLKPLARLVRQAFIQKKSDLVCLKYHLPVRYNTLSTFESAAALCVEYGLTPEELVSELFHLWRVAGGPQPNAMGGATARGLLRHRRPTESERLSVIDGQLAVTAVPTHEVHVDVMYSVKNQYRMLKERSGTTIPSAAAAMAVLRDPDEPLESWFRIAVAGDDPIIWDNFSRIGVRTLNESPKMRQLLIDMGLPVRRLLSQPVAGIPAWARFLEEGRRDG